MLRHPAFLLKCLLVFASASVHAADLAPEVVQLIATGDAADRANQPKEALKAYLPAYKLAPTHVPLLVSLARQYRHLMSDASSSAEKLKWGGLALDYGRQAAKLAPNDSDAQLSTAITYGRLLPLQSRKEQVAATPRIKAGADKALKLNPRNDSAWHVLGRWHQVLAGIGAVKHALGGLLYGTLPTTTNEASVACFEKAIAVNPKRLRHYIELGRTYAQMGNAAQARKFLQKGLAMPSVEYDDPELKQRGREALAKLP